MCQCENEDGVMMRLLRNGEVDGIRQCHGKSFNVNEMVKAYEDF